MIYEKDNVYYLKKGNDYVEDVFLLGEGDEFTMDYKGKTIDFGKMKLNHRDSKGTRVKI